MILTKQKQTNKKQTNKQTNKNKNKQKWLYYEVISTTLTGNYDMHHFDQLKIFLPVEFG